MGEGVVPFPFCQVASNIHDKALAGQHQKIRSWGLNDPAKTARGVWDLARDWGRGPGQGEACISGGLAGLHPLPSWSRQLRGLLTPHGRDLKAAMSAPCEDRRPLPATELHAAAASVGDLTAPGLSSDSLSEVVVRRSLSGLGATGERGGLLGR